MNSEAILNSSSAKNSPKADVRSSSSHKKSSSSSRSSVSGGDHREKSREKNQKHHEKAKINSDMIKVMEMSSAVALEPTIPAVVPPPPPERSSQKFRENENSTVAAVVAASRKPSATSNSSANSREIEINKPQFYFGQTMTDVVKKSSIGNGYQTAIDKVKQNEALTHPKQHEKLMQQRLKISSNQSPSSPTSSSDTNPS